MRLIGRAGQQAVDLAWQKVTGLPLLLLMEAAAAAVCRVCTGLFEAAEGRAILVLAGKGQNGGDAYACARMLLAAGLPVVCREAMLEEAKELPPEASANRQALLALGVRLGAAQPEDFAALAPGSLIVDGLFGTGFRADRPLPERVCQLNRLAADARGRGARIVAIDVPSGLDADSGRLAADAMQADYTVTFIRSKIGLAASPGRFAAGQVIVDPIGVPDQLVEEALAESDRAGGRPPCYQTVPADLLAWRLARPADSHKGLFGKVLLLGGSPGMPGAILLAGEAAARSGAGLVTLAVPETIAPLVLAARPECLLTAIPAQTAGDAADADADLFGRLAAGQSAVAIGPGAGASPWLASALPLLIRSAKQLIIDADGLNYMAARSEYFMGLLRERTSKNSLPPAILTPHPGEFRRLAPGQDLADRQLAAAGLAAHTCCVVILKGASTVVAEPAGALSINTTGNDGLSRGGSGDVLCGLIAGLLAQGLEPAAAARAGVYLHGLAADLASQRLTRRALLPGDVIAGLGEAFRETGWEERSAAHRGPSVSEPVLG